MVFRIVLIAMVVGICFYLYKQLYGNSTYKKCEKCDGKGYWRAMRGERDKCDICQGAGKVIR